MIIVVPSSKEAETLMDDLEFFGVKTAVFFPSYNILPYKFTAYHNETAARRVKTLYGMMENQKNSLIVTTVEGLLQKVIPKASLTGFAELLISGETVDREALIEKLISGGYSHGAIVEEPGDFSARGGILDIYSPLYDDPLRIEFYGDVVDSMRFFSASTQKKKKEAAEAVILPAKETLFEADSRDHFIRRLKRLARSQGISPKQTRSILEKCDPDIFFPGIESFLPLIYQTPGLFFDYVPDAARLILMDREKIEEQANLLSEKVKKEYFTARESLRPCVEPGELFLEWGQALDILKPMHPVSIHSLPLTRTAKDPAPPPDAMTDSPPSTVVFPIERNTPVQDALAFSRTRENPFSPLLKWLSKNREHRLKTVIALDSRRQAETLKSIFGLRGLDVRQPNDFPRDIRELGDISALTQGLSQGFIWREESVALITGAEIFGSKKRKKTAPRPKTGSGLLKYGDLKKGDLVVHRDHGVGRYENLVKLKIEAAENDCLLIIYSDGDKLYLPVDRIGVVEKYMGVDGAEPKLDKLGGVSWERVQKKVKKATRKIAGELLKLYAERNVRQGRVFKDAHQEMERFEAGFPYEETPDQLRAIDDVLNDMSRPAPMDRLVCGDVGYGKTEVALRAAFMACWNGAQTALMVPTTVLAHQHFQTFKERFKDFPINIQCLSRFIPFRQTKEIIEGIQTGTVDIVIGTHRLLSQDVAFKDLGLVILDEEQRFGVKHKERLKTLRTSVDVLALTATPIPRTLHLSMMGIRDISVISTPPELRRPIITYVCEFQDAVIAEAIKKEMTRNGQIFFLHNTIKTIWNMADYLRKLVPGLRLDVAHGRLETGKLERVMMNFLNKKLDMLLCTTIVEAGLDIPSANTIIINRADRFGLSQMYQLRGRVGRSGEQAYAFLFIPDQSLLGKDAQKRLKVLMEHSDLGSGFQIAISDLRIRGGGTILGANQSGHIAAVGYDMFLKLMEQSISELKGSPEAVAALDPEISVPLSAFIPESYIPDVDQRLRAYRRMSDMTEPKQLGEFKEELTDRFGAMPEAAMNLLMKMMLRAISIRAGVKKLTFAGQTLLLYFSPPHQKNPAGIMNLTYPGGKIIERMPGKFLKARFKKQSERGYIMEIKNILKEISHRVSL